MSKKNIAILNKFESVEILEKLNHKNDNTTTPFILNKKEFKSRSIKIPPLNPYRQVNQSKYVLVSNQRSSKQ